MSILFAERPPHPWEVEKLRLILSTYQDGSGQQGGKLPGWRDFERAAAIAFGGIAQESKYIFDVLFALGQQPGVFYGLSCKMRRELNKVKTRGRASMELSNSAGKFWDYLNTKGIDQSNYNHQPEAVGHALIELVTFWHEAVGLRNGGPIDLAKSSYLALLWNKSGKYQLFHYSLQLPDPRKLKWSHPVKSRRIVGEDDSGVIFEWYGESGGQLKYYPKVSDAKWMSEKFQLEPLPSQFETGILLRTEQYFPLQWGKVLENERKTARKS